jgi:hypothetical protein
MAQKRIDRKLDLAVGSVTFTNLENSENVVHTVDGVFGKGTWAALAGLSNGAMAQRAMLHSLNAFGGDAAADKSIDAISAINARVQSVIDGNWTMRGTGSTGATRVTLVDQAVAKVKGITDEEASAAIAKAAEEKGVEPKDIRKGLQKNARVAAAMKDIQATRAAAKAKEAAKVAKGTSDELDF